MENDAVISCIKRTRICYRSWLVELTHGWHRYMSTCICTCVFRVRVCNISNASKQQLYSDIGQTIRESNYTEREREKKREREREKIN